MASRKMRAKRRQERMQQLQRNTAMPPAQESIEELKATNPLEAQQTLLPDEREIIPAKEVEQRIECVPLERIVTEQYQRILNIVFVLPDQKSEVLNVMRVLYHARDYFKEL